MKIKDLKQFIENLPGDMEIFVCCQGYSNFNFRDGEPEEDNETHFIIHDGKLFIADSCAVEDGEGNVL